jgi:hypothetical protein
MENKMFLFVISCLVFSMFFALPVFATGELVYSDGDNLWLREEIDSEPVLLLAAFETVHPRWDSEKVYVYFSMYDSITDTKQIWKINSYFPEEIVKLTHRPSNKGFPVVSKDGTQIAYVRDGSEAGCDLLVQGASDPDAIYVMSIAGMDEGHPVTCGFFQGLSWSSDNYRLATRNKKPFHYTVTEMDMEDDIYAFRSDSIVNIISHPDDVRRVTDTGDYATETWADFSNHDPSILSFIDYNEGDNIKYNTDTQHLRRHNMGYPYPPASNSVMNSEDNFIPDSILAYTSWKTDDEHIMTIIEVVEDPTEFYPYYLGAYYTDDTMTTPYNGNSNEYGHSYNSVIDPDWGYFERTQYPDLIVTATTFNKCANGNCNPITYVKNQGEIASPMPDVHFTINYNGETDTCYVPGDFRILEPGETAISFCLQNEYPYNEEGYQIDAMVDPSDLIEESVEVNNNFEGEAGINCYYPDLVVDEVRMVNRGLYCQMEADVTNIGYAPSQINAPTLFSVSSIDDITNTTIFYNCFSQNPPPLDSGEVYTVYCDMIIPISNNVIWWSLVSVDTFDVVDESIEVNNHNYVERSYCQ